MIEANFGDSYTQYLDQGQPMGHSKDDEYFEYFKYYDYDNHYEYYKYYEYYMY